MISPPRPATKSYVENFIDPARWSSFAPRVGDIVVATPSKSGTTWMQSILALLISGDPEVDAETSMRSPWIDFNLRDVAEVMARLEAQTHRRQVKTHTPLNGIPIWAELRYITVYRHPIDVYFSLLNHVSNQIREISEKLFPPEYFDDDPAVGFKLFLEGENAETACLHAICEHYTNTLAQEPAENLIRLHYRDMQRDLPGTFDKVSSHVGISHPPDLMAQLIEAATFDNMKANAHRFTPSAGSGVWQSDAAFFDSATSNKWEGKLSAADLAAYDARISTLLSAEDRRWLEIGSNPD